MKKSTKFIIFGLGVAGVVSAAKLTKKGVEKTSESVNRLKYKLLVKDKLQDNPNLLAIVDDLDDEEVKTMVQVFERLDTDSLKDSQESFFKSKIASLAQR